MSQESSPERERGFALLIVLWTLVLVSLLILRLTEAGSAEARLGINLRRAAVAEAEADGAFAEAAFRLATKSGAAAHFKVTTPHGTADITIRSEDGEVDLNNASAPIMGALLGVVGDNPADAATLVQAIAAWHTNVPASQMPALEAPYRAAGRRYGPPATPFQSVDELRLVLGMTPSLFDRLAPHLTVFGAGDPDLTMADPVVLRAAASIGETPGTNDAAGSGGGDTYDITVDERAEGARFVRNAVIQLQTAADATPWRILVWSRPEPD